MDQSAFIQLFQANDNFSVPQEIVFVEGTEPAPREEVTQGSLISPQRVSSLSHQETVMAEPQEREVCPVTELCTIQVVTITIKDHVPEVNEVTIPNALASSLKFTCKICENSFETFSDFKKHAKSHLQPVEDQSTTSEISTHDVSDDNEDSSSMDTFHASFDDDTSSLEPSESSQMEAIARELIGLASSPQTKVLPTSTASTSNSTSKTSIKQIRDITPPDPSDAKCFETMACAACDTKFIEDSEWENHMKVMHQIETPYQCAVCAKVCDNMPALRGHVIKVHQKFSQMVCERKWNKHKKNIKGDRPNPCRLCNGSGNSDPLVLENAEKVIPADDPKTMQYRLSRRAQASGYTKCPICAKVLSNMYLSKHVKLHTEPKSRVCSICNKVYRTVGDLNRHKRVHTGEKPFKCVECGKTFANSSGISRHMKVHSQEKRFKCVVCNKQFTRRDGLIKHMAIHNGDKQFGCAHCCDSFRQKRYLIRHYKSVHGLTYDNKD